MLLNVSEDRAKLAQTAAEDAAATIEECLRKRGRARLIAASAASQIEFLEALIGIPGIDWSKIELFHLDEYIGLPMTHPASFCRFLQDRFISKTGISNYHLLNGEADPQEVIRNVSAAISEAPVDIAFVGIGENGHLAFNDPPADFETEAPYIVVTLDEPCRLQQVAEGWFPTFEQVPRRAVSTSVRQILKTERILAIVPGNRKAEAIKKCFEGPISPMAPASILRQHSNTTIYLDRDSASLLTDSTVAALSHTDA